MVVGERRSKLNGRQVEDLGWYNPHLDKKEFNKDRILHWLKVGAKMSPTANNLLVSAGVVDGKKLSKHKLTKKEAPAVAA